MSLAAGDLRDRVNVQQRVKAQDPVSGAMTFNWSTQWPLVPADISDISQRDQIAAHAVNSTVSVRVIMRYLPGLTSQHRLVDTDGIVYSIEGPPIRDKDTRREFVTLSCSVGASNGE